MYSKLAALLCVLLMAVKSETYDKPNILMIMLDDLGRTDVSAFGSEWPTPNIDSFMEDSISLSHHYIGYVCSTSRSQFLTGRHSFHNGYGTLDVFDRAKLGGIPQGTPTVADYLKTYGGYKTYAVGKWQLGYSFNEQTPNYRGFDYFWGFYGGLEEYFDKTAQIRPADGDPHKIRKDKTEYYDFWENMEPDYTAAGTYSTYQYLTKLTDIIDSHNKADEDDYVNEDPFFVYLALQAPHMPFPDEDTEFGTMCDTIYDKYYSDIEDRDGVCEGMLGLDYFMGSLMDYFSSDKLKDMWENTVIIFTTDNGGALSHGSCNYPLRGGKNTYFDGNTRVHTFVGGGYIPDSERGSVRGGLFSNVDWLPTILSFADVIPHEYKAISWNNDLISNKDIPFTFDGYNQYEYIMDGDSTPVRDHIIFQLRPQLDDNSNYVDDVQFQTNLLKIHTTEEDDNTKMLELLNLEEIALVFYDENGKLWKYFNAEESTNEIGNVEKNCNWCIMSDSTTTDNENEIYSYTTNNDSITQALYDLTNDESETYNYYNNMNEKEYTTLLNIIAKNAAKYFDASYSDSSIYLYGNFDCFYTKYNEEAWPKYLDNLWQPFLELSGFGDKLLSTCGFNRKHAMYKLHTNQASNYLTNENDIDDLIIDRSDLAQTKNKLIKYQPVMDEIKRQETIYKNYALKSTVRERMTNSNSASLLNVTSLIALIGIIAVFGIAFVSYKYCNCFNAKIKQNGYEALI